MVTRYSIPPGGRLPLSKASHEPHAGLSFVRGSLYRLVLRALPLVSARGYRPLPGLRPVLAHGRSMSALSVRRPWLARRALPSDGMSMAAVIVLVLITARLRLARDRSGLLGGY